MDNYVTAGSNLSNRLMNVVFVLDTTRSMKRYFSDSNTRILDEMNDLVERLLVNIMESEDLCGITRVAFITFSEGVTMETPFCEIDKLSQGDFRPDPHAYVEQKVIMKKNVYVTIPGGKNIVIQSPRFEAVEKATYSQVGAGVIRALEKLDEERQSFRKDMARQNKMDIRPYVPVMVVISDGAPDEVIDGIRYHTADPEEEERAKKMVKSRCYSEGDATKLVFPIICAIGDEKVRNQMREYAAYSADYLEGFQYIDLMNKGKGFEELIAKIGQSLTKSVSLSEEKRREDAARKKAWKENNGKKETFRAASSVKISDDATLLRRDVQR